MFDEFDNVKSEGLLLRKKIERCPHCKSKNVGYQGLGKYQCKSCSEEFYDDYGKIRHCIDTHPYGLTVDEVCALTGVSRHQVKSFIKNGFLCFTTDENNRLDV